MADSFSFHENLAADHETPPGRKVLVTGAGGTIGKYFAQHAPDRLDLRLMVHEKDEEFEQLKQLGEVIQGDITDLESTHRACQGIDTVLHLAALPSPSSTWSALLKVNIEGTYNTMVAARAAGCRRLIFASSIHAVSGYPPDRQVMADDPVNPGDLYGVSKCFGEAMGRYIAEQEGLSVIAVRICAFGPLESAKSEGSYKMLDAYVSRRDLTQLFVKAIDDTRLRFAIVHGLSDNRFKRLDMSETCELLNYKPQDDLTDLNPALKHLNLSETVREHDEDGDASKRGIREELERLKD